MKSRCLKEVVHFFLSAPETPENVPSSEEGTGAFGAGHRWAPGIILLDHQRLVHFISPTAQHLLNLRQEECLGEPFNYFIREGEKIRVGITTWNNRMGVGEMSLAKESTEGQASFLITIRDITDH